MVSSSANDGEWIMDSVFSFHMTPNHLRFNSLQNLKEGLMSLVITSPVRQLTMEQLSFVCMV